MIQTLFAQQAAPRARTQAARQDVIIVKRAWLFTASLALTTFALGGLVIYLTGLSGSLSQIFMAQPVGAALAAPAETLESSHNPAIGPADAPVTLVEFSDYNCTYCKTFHDQTLPALLAKYGSRLRYVYRDFPALGGQQAAEATSCAADQGAYWDYHNALFANPGAYASVEQLATLAHSLGLDSAQLRDCLASEKHRNEVLKDYEAGTSYGVRGTPTFFVDGVRMVGAQPLSVFENAIDQRLGK